MLMRGARAKYETRSTKEREMIYVIIAANNGNANSQFSLHDM